MVMKGNKPRTHAPRANSCEPQNPKKVHGALRKAHARLKARQATHTGGSKNANPTKPGSLKVRK